MTAELAASMLFHGSAALASLAALAAVGAYLVRWWS